MAKKREFTMPRIRPGAAGRGFLGGPANFKSVEADAGNASFRTIAKPHGKDDFLYSSVAPTRAVLDRQGIRHVYNESGGGHTWINWRRYLDDFLPRLF